MGRPLGRSLGRIGAYKMAHTLPGIGLTGGFADNETGWGAAMRENLRRLSVLSQAVVIDLVAALPGAPADGDVYILTTTGEVQARDAGAWVAYAPQTGWSVFCVADGKQYRYTGAAWAEVASGGGGGGIAEAPLDGTPYARREGLWVPEQPMCGLTSFAATASSTAFATKGTMFLPTADTRLLGGQAFISTRSAGWTYKACLVQLADSTFSATSTIAAILAESAVTAGYAFTTHGPASGFLTLPFTTPVDVAAGTPIALLLTRTDAATDTTSVSVNTTTGLRLDLPMVPMGFASFATRAPAIGQAPTTAATYAIMAPYGWAV